jgi:hypothetical protein
VAADLLREQCHGDERSQQKCIAAVCEQGHGANGHDEQDANAAGNAAAAEQEQADGHGIHHGVYESGRT